MKPWRTVSRTPVLNRGKYLVVEDHEIQLPDGRLIRDWAWLVMPDYVNVFAETARGTLLCFEQTKYAVATGTSLAPVGGYLETGEDPLAGARRELLEETGYDAPEWISLGSYAADGNRGGGTAHLFLARGAAKNEKVASDDLEEQILMELTRDEFRQAVLEGKFRVLSWAANAALALQRLDAGA
jgi:8-oxo-dGTP pyrophosphatase MutT (NUDIX family)